MKKRLLVILIGVAVLLSACSPRLVGEAKAKAQAAALAGLPDEDGDAQGGAPSKAQANDDDAPQQVQSDDQPEQPAYFTYAPQADDSSRER